MGLSVQLTLCVFTLFCLKTQRNQTEFQNFLRQCHDRVRDHKKGISNLAYRDSCDSHIETRKTCHVSDCAKASEGTETDAESGTREPICVSRSL
jgi:hypothetical protein